MRGRRRTSAARTSRAARASRRRSGPGEAVAALRRGVQRVPEQQRLLGPQEGEVRTATWLFAPVQQDVRGAPDRVGDPAGQVGDLLRVGVRAGRTGQQRGRGDGVHRRAALGLPGGQHRGPNRCQPQSDQCRTSASSRAAPPSTGIRSTPSGSGPAPVSLHQHLSRASSAACSAATAGSWCSSGSDSADWSSWRGTVAGAPVRAVLKAAPRCAVDCGRGVLAPVQGHPVGLTSEPPADHGLTVSGHGIVRTVTAR